MSNLIFRLILEVIANIFAGIYKVFFVSKRPAEVDKTTGDKIVQFDRFIKVLSFGVCGFLIGIGYIIFDTFSVGSLFLVSFGLVITFIIHRYRLTFNNQVINIRPFFFPTYTIKWEDIKKAAYIKLNTLLISTDLDSFYLYTIMSGSKEFVLEFEKQRPEVCPPS